MELELSADPQAVAGLGRLKALAAGRDGKARSQPLKIVWHDSPEHALLAEGLTLAEQRGTKRLERIVPGLATWLPGQPAPVVDPEPDPAALPSPLAPLAAFDGRRTVSSHRIGEALLTLTVERGVLRAVTAVRPAARIVLSGEEAAVRAGALLIAGAIPAAIPLTSLAGEGIALATGRTSPPRHKGAPVLPLPQTAADALAHTIGHLTDVTLANAMLTGSLDAAGADAVHQMRVAIRRARSALSVFRPAVEPAAFEVVNDSLKLLAARLGPSRDWDVFVDETMPPICQALPDNKRIERLQAAASRRRRDCRSALAGYLAGVEFRKLGIELSCFAGSTSWHVLPSDPAQPLPAFAAAVLQHRWRKLLSAGKHAQDLDVAGLHGVRLRAKRARYAAEIFTTLYPGKPAYRFIRRLGQVQEQLGVLNDGAVASHLLEELGGAGGRHGYAAGVVVGFIAARAGKIRPRIVAAFEKFRRQPPYWA
jgi:CHAD domain-containing protein